MHKQGSIETLWNDALTFNDSNETDDSGGSDRSLVTSLLLENNESEMYADVDQLGKDMNTMINQQNLCDVVFLVGDNQTPVYGVKAVLALRSRVFYETFYPHNEDNESNAFVDAKASKLSSRLHKAIFDATSFACMAPVKGALHYAECQVTTVHVTEFDLIVFKDLIQFLHQGTVTIKCRSCIGLMYAADQFGIEELRLACITYANDNLSPKTAVSLIHGAIFYLEDEFVENVTQKLLQYIDYHAEICLSCCDIEHLPLNFFVKILSRPSLCMQSISKFHCIEKWIGKNTNTLSGRDVYQLIMTVDYSKISSKVLMKEIRPIGLVPDSVLVQAICVQETGTLLTTGKDSIPTKCPEIAELHNNFAGDVHLLYDKLNNKSSKHRKLLLGHSEIVSTDGQKKSFSSRMHSLNLSARRLRRSLQSNQTVSKNVHNYNIDKLNSCQSCATQEHERPTVSGGFEMLL